MAAIDAALTDVLERIHSRKSGRSPYTYSDGLWKLSVRKKHNWQIRILDSTVSDRNRSEVFRIFENRLCGFCRNLP